MKAIILISMFIFSGCDLKMGALFDRKVDKYAQASFLVAASGRISNLWINYNCALQ